MIFLPDHCVTELRMAQLMQQQEASGFRFDFQKAEEIRREFAIESEKLVEKILGRYPLVPDKVFTPRRADKKKGYVAGATHTRLKEFNPTSRPQIAWVLQHIHGLTFTKLTEKGKPQVNRDSLEELAVLALQQGKPEAAASIEDFLHLLDLQKWNGQLSEGDNSWLNMVNKTTGCIHHSCMLGTQTGRNAHKSPNLGQTNKQEWSRKLFLPHERQVLVGVDLEGLELKMLGGYLAAFDDGAFADVVVNGDIHQQNADRVGCTRSQVKTLTYGFIYGGGDLKLGSILHPEYSDHEKKSLGAELRRKFLAAIPGLEPLVTAIKQKVRTRGWLKGLDKRPIYCRSEHSGLNFCLQSAGAIISKQWCIQTEDLLIKEGFTYGSDYSRCAYVHDEQQFSVVPQLAEKVMELVVAAAPLAGEYYNFRVPITASGVIGPTWHHTH